VPWSVAVLINRLSGVKTILKAMLERKKTPPVLMRVSEFSCGLI
jgi:hypothetical protein